MAYADAVDLRRKILSIVLFQEHASSSQRSFLRQIRNTVQWNASEDHHEWQSVRFKGSVRRSLPVRWSVMIGKHLQSVAFLWPSITSLLFCIVSLRGGWLVVSTGLNIDLSIGHVTSSITWPIDLQLCYFILVSHLNRVYLPPFSRYLHPKSKYIVVTTLTFQGDMTSPVTWPFDSPRAISYRCSVVTESLFRTILEIMGHIINTLLQIYCRIQQRKNLKIGWYLLELCRPIYLYSPLRQHVWTEAQRSFFWLTVYM